MRRLVVGLSLLLGCNGGMPGMTGDDAPPDDAAPSDTDATTVDADTYVCTIDTTTPCWPTATPVPHGSLTIGMGRGGYQPLPEEVPMEWGFQDGFMFVLSAHMTGFAPGVAKCLADPSNPRTRIRVFFDDTNVPLTKGAVCPIRTAYKDIGGGVYEMVQEVGIVFDTCWRSNPLIGKRMRIEAEIMDLDGNYASETRVVTAAAPVYPGYPMDYGVCPP